MKTTDAAPRPDAERAAPANAPASPPVSSSAEPPAPEAAAQAFAALGSEPRLEVIRVLVRAGPEGLAVGALQARLGIAPSTLSHHLRFLSAAGLLTQARRGRSLICRARFDAIAALSDFLQQECCADAPSGAASDESPER